MFDITNMLHEVIDLEYDVDDANELLIGPQTRRQTIFLMIDVALADFADSVGWYKKVTQPTPDQQQVTQNYVKSLALILLFAAKQQWTHLVVLNDEQWQRVTGVEATAKLADLNKEYLAIKHFLSGAYFNHRQEDFRHAWHLLLKMGIVDLHRTPKEIMAAYQRFIADEKEKLTH